jgi:hypothetical protein
MTEDDARKLHLLLDRIAKRSRIGLNAMLPLAMLTIVPLTIATASHSWVAFAAAAAGLVAMTVGLLVLHLTDSAERKTRQALEAHYRAIYVNTRWLTPAGAEGVVLEVHSFGEALVLAFPSGVKERYSRSDLTAVA